MVKIDSTERNGLRAGFVAHFLSKTYTKILEGDLKMILMNLKTTRILGILLLATLALTFIYFQFPSRADSTAIVIDDSTVISECGLEQDCRSGKDTCKQGFVWREASPNDKVCVTSATRTQTGRDNALAATRRKPNGGAYGANTCKAGFVWREAFKGDFVCVTSETRAQAKSDNSQTAGRRSCQYNCAHCNDGSCQCGYGTKEQLCSTHRGNDPTTGCIQQQ